MQTAIVASKTLEVGTAELDSNCISTSTLGSYLDSVIELTQIVRRNQQILVVVQSDQAHQVTGGDGFGICCIGKTPAVDDCGIEYETVIITIFGDSKNTHGLDGLYLVARYQRTSSESIPFLGQAENLVSVCMNLCTRQDWPLLLRTSEEVRIQKKLSSRWDLSKTVQG